MSNVADIRTHIELTTEVLDVQQAEDFLQDPAAGAQCVFIGRVRAVTHRHPASGQPPSSVLRTDHLLYQCYAPLAKAELSWIAQQAGPKFALKSCFIAHRLGRLEVGEASIVVAVAAAHRKSTFAATAWIMDRIKESVPIWKKECDPAGSGEWVHHGSPG